MTEFQTGKTPPKRKREEEGEGEGERDEMGMTIIYLSGKKEGGARIIKKIVIRTRAYTGDQLIQAG